MTALSMQLLGDFRVRRGDEELNLPPSKKTRALLAYLALNDREFRREHLCELLWEIPDDPRGSLRWSLSKIRRLVDDDEEQRIVANRSHVSLDASAIAIDSRDLQQLVDQDLQSAGTEELILAAASFDGEFLAGLELASFNEFSSWCVAEREQVTRAQISLLKEVVKRLNDDPEQGLAFARNLVLLNPYDKESRLSLIELMLRCGREKEAEQQVEQGVRLLREVGEGGVELQRALTKRPTEQSKIETHVLDDVEARPVTGPLTAGSPEKTAPVSASKCEQKLVGREQEIRALQDSFNQVLASGKAASLLFKGEPGIGKSSLLACAREFARQADAYLLQAGAFESEIVRPFALWNDALRESSTTDAAELLSGNERIDRDRLFSSFSKLINEQARRRPVVILFDDMQWSDESSAAALHYVLRMNAQLPLWVVMGARDQELETNFAVLSAFRGLRQDKLLTTETVKPLAEADVIKLISAEAPDIDNHEISERCQGNPLLAIELSRAVAAGDVIGTLNELIGERLARMAESTTAMLHWAAVLAPHISIGSLIRYTKLDDDTLEQALEEAEKNGFLFPNETGFKFSHDLVTGSIYRSISPTRRKSMHRRIAEMLEADTALDLKLASELARHAAQSGDALLAARAMVQASKLCLRFYANDDAHKLAERGMLYVGELSEVDRVCLTLELKEVQLMSAPVKDWEAKAAEFITLAEAALDHGVLESARLGYQMASNVRWAHGQWSGAQKSILQAERVSRGGSEEVHIVGMAEAARCLLLLEKDLPEADAMLMEASARAERNRVDSDALPAARGMMHYYEDRMDEAEELLDEARTRAKAMGDRMNEFQANEYLTMMEIEKQDFAGAKSRCSKLLEIGEKLRQGSEEPFARALNAICDYALNETETDRSGVLEQDLEPALESLRRFDAKQRLTYALNRTAMLDVGLKNWEQAISLSTEALNNAEIMERPSEIITARTILAEVAKANGNDELINEHIQALLALPKTLGAKWARDRANQMMDAHSEQ